MRTLVIGDIHGGLKGLEQVIAQTTPNADDTLIFIGDYVDGWSESAATIQFLMELSGEHQCVFIRGNHDELLLEYLETGNAKPMWLASGGESTRDNYLALSDEQRKSHIEFIKDMKTFHVDSSNKLYVHAGFTNIHGPQYEYYPHLVSWDRTLWETACALDPKMDTDSSLYPKRLKLFEEIFIGHTPVTRIGHNTPVARANVWNVDTGAAFKGRISILDADSKEFWQSEPLYQLYPNERGRN